MCFVDNLFVTLMLMAAYLIMHVKSSLVVRVQSFAFQLLLQEGVDC